MEERVGEGTCDRPEAPPGPDGTVRFAAGRPAVRPETLREGSPPLTLDPSAEEADMFKPLSMSVNAFSTFGRLKLLLPMGPTMPAAAFSVGFLNAPRGSRSARLEFSS